MFPSKHCFIKGSAKLVYEDQGESFMFKEGDCILNRQASPIVLESFDDLEVIEVTSPADHATFLTPTWSCPTAPWRT